MVTTTGRISPYCELVWALKPLQNSMMLTPCWPRAGPTGGEAFALPAGICSFTIAWTFFAMGSEPLHLVVLELHRRHTSEDGHHHLELAALRVEIVDAALEVHERPLDDPHLVPLLEGGLELGLLGALLHLLQDPFHLFRGKSHRLRPRPHEARDLGGGAHEVPRVVGELHLHEEIPGEELLLRLDLLALPDLADLLRGNDHASEAVLKVEDLRPRLDGRRHLVLEPRVGVDDEPLLRRRARLAHQLCTSVARTSPIAAPDPRSRKAPRPPRRETPRGSPPPLAPPRWS